MPQQQLARIYISLLPTTPWPSSVTAGPIAKEVAEEYGISPKRSASLLDTFSCIFPGTIPYGTQMLVASSTCATLGYALSAFDIIPLLV